MSSRPASEGEPRASVSAGEAPAKTKEQALEACVVQHKALVDCFRTCNFMGICCKEEHHAFWDCYARERGTGETKVTSTINKWFSRG